MEINNNNPINKKYQINEKSGKKQELPDLSSNGVNSYDNTKANEAITNIGKSVVFKGKKENLKKLKEEIENQTIINYKGEEVKRFNEEDVERILKSAQKNEELTLTLVREQQLTIHNETEPRFNATVIEKLVNAYDVSPELVNKILDAKETFGEKVDDYGAKKIISAYEKDPEFTLSALDKKTKNYRGEIVLAYSSSDIEQLATHRQTNKTLFDNLFNAKVINRDGEEENRYNVRDIAQLMELYSENPKLTDRLVNEKIIDKNGNETPRFSVSDIVTITDSAKDYPENISDLLDEKYTNLIGEETFRFDNLTREEKFRFDAKGIETFISIYKKDPEFANYLRECRDFYNTDAPRFSVSDMKVLSDIQNEKNSDFIKGLVSEKIEIYKNKSRERFSVYGIKQLTELYETHPQEVLALLDEKSLDRFDKLNPTFDANEIKRLVLSGEENSDLTMSLVKLKRNFSIGDNYPVYNSFDISRLSANADTHPEESKQIATQMLDANGHKVPRFNILETEKLQNWLNYDSELVMNLVSETDKNNPTNPKYDFKQIEELIEKDVVNKFAKNNNLDKSDTNLLINAFKLDAKATVNLINSGQTSAGYIYRNVYSAYEDKLKEKMAESSIGYPKKLFNSNDISTLSLCIRKNPELTKFLIEEKTDSGVGVKQRYSVKDIEKIVNLSEESPEIVDKLVSLRTPLNDKFPLKYKNIEKISKLSKQDKDTTLNLIDCLTNNRAGLLDSLERLDEYVERTLPYAKNQLDDIEKLLNAKKYSKYDNEIDTAFYMADIPLMCSLLKDYPEETRYLLNQKYIAPNGQEVSRFNRWNIMDILNDVVQNPEVTKSLIEETVKDEAGNNVSKYSINDIDILSKCSSVWGKNSVSEMTKQEKRQFSQIMMANKNMITNSVISANVKEKIPFFPANEEEYTKMMNQLANGLNIPLKSVDAEATDKFNKALLNLANTIKETKTKDISTPSLKISHKNFINNIENIIKDLPKTEQAKICELYGFNIADGKLNGYPNTDNADLSNSDITDKNSQKAVQKINNLVKEYTTNNSISVDNKKIDEALKSLTDIMPELFNQIDGGDAFAQTLKSLEKIVKSDEYNNLSGNDKKVLILATLLHSTDKISNDTKESAFDAYFISKKFNMSEKDAQKVYSIIETTNTIEKFMNTSKHKVRVDSSVDLTQEREIVFDRIAFDLKEDNLHELSKMLYSTMYPDGFTRRFDNLLEKRITEIKSTDFILPQTSQKEMIDYSTERVIEKDGVAYKLNIVNASDIPDFYVFAHTTEAGYSTGGTRGANFANFDIFNTLNDDKVICTAYLSADRAGLIDQFHHAFIFDVKNSNQYVASNYDISSLSRDIDTVIGKYYRDKGIQDWHGINQYSHRTKISDTIKRELYGSTEGEDVNKDYIRRLEHIKTELGGQPLTVSKLKEIDPEFAKAYEIILTDGYDGILANKPVNGIHHNEVLVSNPKISAIATDDLGSLPAEYLEKAQNEGLPIVVFKKS